MRRFEVRRVQGERNPSARRRPNLEIIGEAAKKAPEEFRAKYPAIEWRAMSAMRDRLIHDYFGVDYELVWDVAQNRIPILRHKIARSSRPNKSRHPGCKPRLSHGLRCVRTVQAAHQTGCAGELSRYLKK